MTRVLITDGEQRAALAMARSLGRAGHEVVVTSARPGTPAAASRYTRAHRVLPPPLSEPGRFVRELARFAREVDAAVVLPVSEAALLPVLEAAESFAPAVLPFPDLPTFRRVCDKAAVMAAAAAAGVEVPRQVVVHGPGAPPAELPRLPVVVKPSRSVAGNGRGRLKLGVAHAATAAELEAVLAALPAEAYPVLIQERIVGPGTGVFVLLWDGRLVARFAHRRLREKPPAGGVSVYRESVAMDEPLLARSIRLLQQLGWQGVAMIEYKRDRVSGTPYLMEINGRFWGSLQLAIDAGVDFPRLLVECALGHRPAPVTRYRAGVRSRWWLGDVDHLLARLRRDRRTLALPPDAPPRSRAVLDFLTLWRPGDRGEVFRWSDPLPALAELRDWTRGR